MNPYFARLLAKHRLVAEAARAIRLGVPVPDVAPEQMTTLELRLRADAMRLTNDMVERGGAATVDGAGVPAVPGPGERGQRSRDELGQ